jgi:predicted porin
MKKVVTSLLATAAALYVGIAAPALAVDFKAGSWDLSFTGDVNAFADYNACGHAAVGVYGGLACNKPAGTPNTFAIESGLLPNALVFTAKSRQMDLDVSTTIGIYPGVSSTSKTGLAQPIIDARQGFLTFGDKSWGTVKIGRDLGLFGGDAILSDMTLLGMGSLGAYGGLYVTLGHIGTGYIYADWIPQISYFSPKFGNASFAVGVMQPFDTATFGGLNGAAAPINPSVALKGHETPMVQAKLSYDLEGPVTGKLWASGLVENVKSVAPPANPDATMIAGEAGAKVNVSGLGVLGYGYYGAGLGTTGIGFDGVTSVNGALATRKSYGFLGQLTYQLGKLRPGVSYGMSFLKVADGEAETGSLLKWNGTVTAGLWYTLTDSVTLVAEYDHTESRSQGGDKNHDNTGALGAILFF